MNPLFSVTNFQRISAGNAQAVRLVDSLVAATPQTIDFRDFNIDGDTFSPQGVIIDASLADADCTVEIPETKFRVTCTKGAMVQMPYPAVAMQTAIISGDGDTKVFFVDYPIFPYNSASTGGGMPTQYLETVVAGTNITIDNTDPKNPVISAAGGGGAGGPLSFVSAFGFLSAVAAGTADLPFLAIQAQSGDWSLNAGKLVVPPNIAIARVTINVMPANAGGARPAVQLNFDYDPFTKFGTPASASSGDYHSIDIATTFAASEFLMRLTNAEELATVQLTMLIEVLQFTTP